MPNGGVSRAVFTKQASNLLSGQRNTVPSTTSTRDPAEKRHPSRQRSVTDSAERIRPRWWSPGQGVPEVPRSPNVKRGLPRPPLPSARLLLEAERGPSVYARNTISQGNLHFPLARSCSNPMKKETRRSCCCTRGLGPDPDEQSARIRSAYTRCAITVVHSPLARLVGSGNATECLNAPPPKENIGSRTKPSPEYCLWCSTRGVME